MSRACIAWLFVLLGVGEAYAASDVRLAINVQRREREDRSKKSFETTMVKKGDQCTYDIVVMNTALKETPKLTVKYVIFVELERLGEKAGAERTKRVDGSKDLDALKSQAKATVVTEEFGLMRQNLQPGWHYKNGGRANAKDTVKGIWVKVFDGDTLLGEYANPLTIKSKESFDK